MTTNREWLYSLDVADLSDWFDAEHVDDLGHPTDMSQKSADCVRNDGKMSETGVSANDVDANDENATCNNSGENVTHDSREKLEDKAFNLIARMVNEAYTMGAHEADWSVNRQSVRNCITELFDGVAAITRKTEQAAWIQQANGLIHEANVRADELKADNTELRKRFSEIAELNGSAWQDGFEKGGESRDDAIAGWRAETDRLRDELAKRDKGIARLKRQRDEARQQISILEAECDDCVYKQEWQTMDRLETERDALAHDLQDCERQRERLRQALGCAIDHAHEILSLVTLDGEAIG